MRGFTFQIVDSSQPDPIVIDIRIETDRRARILAQTLLDYAEELDRVEVHEAGAPLFFVGRLAAL